MTAFTRILCPIDFSDTSAHALSYADAIAGWYGAALTVQHVYLPLTVGVPGMPDVVEQISDEDRTRLTADVLAFAHRAATPPPQVVIDSGRPADEIVARTMRDRPDLLVIGTHGASGFRHLVLGSVTEKVLRQVACPVLTVPPRADTTALALPFRRILCAVDFSEWSLAALDLAVQLAAPSQATVIAVHVIEWPWHEPPEPDFAHLPEPQATALRAYRTTVTENARGRLAAAVQGVVGQRGHAETLIVHGKPHEWLLQIAGDRGADLIVLGVHGRSTLDVTLFGSTTNQVVRHAQCPVLTVRR